MDKQNIVTAASRRVLATKEYNDTIGLNLTSNEAKEAIDRRMAHLAHNYVMAYLEGIITNQDENVTPELRFKASQEILNRYMGKPTERIELNTSVELKIDV